MVFENLKDNPQMSRMFFLIPRVNKDIINKDNNEQVQVLFEHYVQQIHKSCKSIG